MNPSSLTQLALEAHHKRLALQSVARLEAEERRAQLRESFREEAANITAGFVEKLLGIPVRADRLLVEFNPDDLPVQVRFRKEGRLFLCQLADTHRPMKLMLQEEGGYHEINDLADLGALIERFPLPVEPIPDPTQAPLSGASNF